MRKLLIFFVAAICSCNSEHSPETKASAEEQTKLKLLEQAGLGTTDKTVVYEYVEQNDSRTGMLNLVPANGIMNLTAEEMAKGKLLNVFITAAGQQYNTTLMRRGNSFVTRVVSIDGNLFEEHVYREPEIRVGTPPFACDNDCSTKCTNNCLNYFRRSIYPDLQEQANATCKPVFYCMACPLGPTPCVYILFCIRPEDSVCGLQYAGDIGTRKMGVMIIRNPAVQK